MDTPPFHRRGIVLGMLGKIAQISTWRGVIVY